MSLFALVLCVSTAESTDMMKKGPWTRAVTHKDEKGVEALYRAYNEAMKKGDLDASAALHDFPLHMATDDATGDYQGKDYTREMWIAEMKPFFDTPMPIDTKHSVSKKTFFNSESVATVIEEHTQTIGKNVSKWISTSTVVLKNGKWRFKTMLEAGWGRKP